jgi:hypothetical protein
MSIQAYDADMVERPGIEALAAAGVGNLWRSMGRIWPLWSVLTFAYAMGVLVLEGQVGPAASGLLRPEVLAAAAGSSLVAGLVTGIAIRVFLYREGAWRPDLGLGAYALIVMLLGTGPAAFAEVSPVLAIPQGGPSLPDNMGLVVCGLAVGLLTMWMALRLTLWPIGRLVGDAEMSAGRSWRQMRGAVMGYILAVVLLSAPVFILEMMVVMLMKPEGHLLTQVSVAPLNSLMALLAAAVAAEIYRMRVRLQPTASVFDDEDDEDDDEDDPYDQD